LIFQTKNLKAGIRVPELSNSGAGNIQSIHNFENYISYYSTKQVSIHTYVQSLVFNDYPRLSDEYQQLHETLRFDIGRIINGSRGLVVKNMDDPMYHISRLLHRAPYKVKKFSDEVVVEQLHDGITTACSHLIGKQ